MDKKIAGWILLITGIIIIGISLYSSYKIFTGKTQPPGIFQPPQSQSVSTQQTSLGQVTQVQLQQLIAEQLKGLVPADAISKTLNFAVWAFLAFILIFGGAEMATIGTKLLEKQ